MAGAAGRADLADDRERDVLRGDAVGQLAVDLDAHVLGLLLDQRLRGEHMLDLEVPMPCASAPNAPCVEVWLSPQTIVVPGSVKPCSGPMTWTMPWRVELVEIFDAEVAGVLGERLDLLARSPDRDAGFERSEVGTL
jgi:hypothetical protein